MSKDWDIESYRNEYENEDHWQLRKRFMLAHKDKFSEDELVCLAQVFTNIEFLGCRYPDQTMIRVAELAKGVVELYREQRKNSLKRTFVAASDAASAKAKGQKLAGEESGPPSKMRTKNNNHAESSKKIESDTLHEKIPEAKAAYMSDRTLKYGGVRTYNINSEKQLQQLKEDKLKKFVLFLTAEEAHPVSEIQRSAALNCIAPRWELGESVGRLKICKLYLNDEIIATAVGENLKQSKENAAIAGIAKLQESHFTVKVKSKFFSDTIVQSSHLDRSNNSNKKLEEDNVGRKLMKLMGWQGGGLGSKGQGIEEPITASLQVQRCGFGQRSNDYNLQQFNRKVREYVRTWINSNSDQDLVFSSEFSADERKIIHEVARQFSVKSKSHGKEANRQLVISRKLEPWEIVEQLKKSGGNSDKYELIYPKGKSTDS